MAFHHLPGVVWPDESGLVDVFQNVAVWALGDGPRKKKKIAGLRKVGLPPPRALDRK